MCHGLRGNGHLEHYRVQVESRRGAKRVKFTSTPKTPNTHLGNMESGGCRTTTIRKLDRRRNTETNERRTDRKRLAGHPERPTKPQPNATPDHKHYTWRPSSQGRPGAATSSGEEAQDTGKAGPPQTAGKLEGGGRRRRTTKAAENREPGPVVSIGDVF